MDIDPREGTVTDPFTLQVTVSGEKLSQVSRPEFESSQDFEMEFSGTSTSHSMLNGVSSAAVSFAYQVTPRSDLKPGEYQLPRGKCQIDSKVIELNPPTVKIVQSTEGSPDSKAGSYGVDFTQLVDNIKPFVGQQIIYRAEIVTGTVLNSATLSDSDFSGFWHESFGKAREVIRSVGNRNIKVYSIREALFPVHSGPVEIPGRSLTGQIRVESRQAPQSPRRGWSPFDDIWPDLFDSQYSQVITRKFIAKPVSVTVRPLPPAPIPNLKYVPVGSFSIKSSLDRSQIKQGEGVTLRIEIAGDGNLRPYELSPAGGSDIDKFKIYNDAPDVSVSADGERATFKKVFKVSFVARVSGELNLPTFKIVTFDPKSEEYKIIDTPTAVLTVAADENVSHLTSTPLPQSAIPDSVSGSISAPPLQPVIGTDLFPQYEASELFSSANKISDEIFYILLAGLALTGFGASQLLVARARRLADPLKILQLNAAKKARERIRALRVIPINWDQVAQTYLLYLKERFRFEKDGVTPQDVRVFLRAKTGKDSIAELGGGILQEIDRFRYAGRSVPSSTEVPENQLMVVDRVLRIIEELELNG